MPTECRIEFEDLTPAPAPDGTPPAEPAANFVTPF